MMTQALEMSVLSAPLAAIDRRALSQAWYSALHVAKKTRPEPVRAEKPLAASPAESRRVPPGPSKRAQTQTPHSRKPRRANKEARPLATAPDRRISRTELARDIERALFTPRAQRRHATLAFGKRRVHVAVASAPGGVRIVAVCSPAIREAVARALAQARFALAARHVPCS